VLVELAVELEVRLVERACIDGLTNTNTGARDEGRLVDGLSNQGFSCMYFKYSGAPGQVKHYKTKELQKMQKRAKNVNASTWVQDIVRNYAGTGAKKIAAFQQLDI
jgi:hypothetical protein